MHNSTGRYTSTYDELDREEAVEDPAGKVITYTYDAAGARSVMIDPDGGRFTYAYDAAGRVDHLVNPDDERTTYVYDDAGRVLSEHPANGARTTYGYDDSGRVTAVVHQKSDATTITRFDYAYDGAGNRTSVLEWGGARVTWTYDDADQLTREHRSGASAHDTTFTYDAAGNRQVKIEDDARTTYTYDDANQLETSEDSSGTSTYTYDAAGNLEKIEDAGNNLNTFTWDCENRLASAEQPYMTKNEFEYNADGLRVSKTDSEGTAKFVWDGQNVLLETDSGGTTQGRYTLKPEMYGDLISQTRGQAVHFAHGDALGSVRALTDDGEDVTDEYIFEAFGKSIGDSGLTTNPYRFVGKLGYQYDADFQQYYLRARYLDPATGRFLSRDPQGNVDGPNVYLYVLGNPVIVTDPTGYKTCLPGLTEITLPPTYSEPKEIKRGTAYSKIKVTMTNMSNVCYCHFKPISQAAIISQTKYETTIFIRYCRPGDPGACGDEPDFTSELAGKQTCEYRKTHMKTIAPPRSSAIRIVQGVATCNAGRDPESWATCWCEAPAGGFYAEYGSKWEKVGCYAGGPRKPIEITFPPSRPVPLPSKLSDVRLKLCRPPSRD